ncbi:unnamed protein product [Blepharisma stoltei]|uniref:Ribosomal RNA-processing protein 8 n=1 Tax=Blepharisma stoltei TaxID=1481888 RepID=A0AAU9J175_9CILI|nr:unnamed protein product [Blepharisma stoltei]
MKRKRSREDRLQGGKFRFLNEMLYTTESSRSFKLFQENPEMFEEYHKGFKSQIESWPVKPISLVEEEVRKLYSGNPIKLADLGCGDGILYTKLSDLERIKVYSYDLIAKADHITACDITKLPLQDRALDIAVFCLSLMGTNHVEMVKEAYRCLKKKGYLIVAEVASRFVHDEFIDKMKLLGFKLNKEIIPNSFFSLFIFRKFGQCSSQPESLLNPCIYKKR